MAALADPPLRPDSHRHHSLPFPSFFTFHSSLIPHHNPRPSHRLALVPHLPPSRYRNHSSLKPGHGRSLRLPPPHRPFHHARLACPAKVGRRQTFQISN